MSRPCVIVEVSDSHNWNSHFGGGSFIPERDRPTVLQVDRDKAEAELLRLTALHPERRFALFEAMVLGTTVKVPTHITLGGAIVAERGIPSLVEIQSDTSTEDLPF